MNQIYEEFRTKAFSALRGLSKEFPEFADAEMLVASAETKASLKRNTLRKNIDTSWVDAIEQALPALDLIIRNPGIAIEDVDEILPIELSKHITEKSIKHLAQHTNLILDVKDNDEVVPQKILNVYHEETYLTYENKFVNTLLARLSAFVDKRYRSLVDGSGIERNYKFDYVTEFEHHLPDDGGRNSARINLRIELTSPLNEEMSESDIEVIERYKVTVERIKRINMALISYRSSAFSQRLGRNYVRPPVIRTNAILKNKNLRECLTLWEYIESYDKVGYTLLLDEYKEIPSSNYITDLYSSVALQYTNFYNGVAENEGNRLISKKHLIENDPDFNTDTDIDELEDYVVYDSEYKKTVPVSRLMNNKKKLSEDEKRIHTAIIVALKADEILNAELVAKEAEARRLAREKRLAEEAERKRLEEEARLRAEAEAKEAEARRLAELAAMPPVEISYRRSFMARFIQTTDEIKEYYDEIKNLLLSYKGVKARTSWSAESFKCGRQHIAKIDVKGKTLYVSLALDPKEYENTKYFFSDVSEKSRELPMLLKVKSERGKRHAIELIEAEMAKLGIERTEREYEDFKKPFEETEALIDQGLIKVILPKGVEYIDGMPVKRLDFEEIEARRKQLEAEAAEAKRLADEAEAKRLAELAAMTPVEISYRRSFMARFIQTTDEIKEYYDEIKNLLLSYKGVKARISWSAENFKRGRQHIAKIDVKGKTMYVSLALDPKEYENTKYFFNDVSERYPELPMQTKVKSERGKRHVMELIVEEMEKLGFEKLDEREYEDFKKPFEETDALIDQGLIKVILPKGVEYIDGMPTRQLNFEEIEAIRRQAEAEEAEKRRVAEAEEAERQRIAAEEEAKRLAEEEAKRLAEEEAKRLAEEEAKRLAEEEAKRLAEEEAKRLAEEEAERLAEEEAKRLAEEAAAEVEADTFINEIAEEDVLEKELDKIIELEAAGERVSMRLTSAGTPVVSRKGRRFVPELDFVFTDSKCDTGAVLLPYTREQYLALPRKKKKSVLTNVRRLIEYREISNLIYALKFRRSENPRILERIAILEERCESARRILPNTPRWEESVRRVNKH